ncbi:MAG: pyruvate ferredoxin oxidoreductase [Chloroflexi bacterium]|nr:pyruvate ferredoxin oxidoreductase [Chloroflexota bacterium]
MAKTVATTGNLGCAFAMKQINPDVVAAYPITPQTQIVEEFANFVANGEVDTEYINVESEHSAMSACIGASAAGSRVMTATSSQGLAYMWEQLYIAAAMRCPIVMHNVNRALSGPINIHCDHSDSMGARDAGWVQIFSENAQEAYDNTIIAVRVAEHMDVRLPVMVLMDGFIVSHAIDRFDVIDDAAVREFVGPFNALYPLLDLDNPVTVGSFAMPPFYMEQKRQLRNALDNARGVVKAVSDEYGRLSGRTYDLFEAYRLDDADVGIVVIGSTAGTAKYTVDLLRSQGVKAGLLKVRLFRPFPVDGIARALSHLKAAGIMDRADAFGAEGGPLYLATKAALYDVETRPKLIGYVYGLGGRDTGPDQIESVFRELSEVASGKQSRKSPVYLGVKE